MFQYTVNPQKAELLKMKLLDIVFSGNYILQHASIDCFCMLAYCNGDELNTRCESGLCRNSDEVCGCTSDSHCPSSEVCYSVDNKCYSGGLSLGQSCAADNGDDVNARCASGLCRNSDKVCVCTSDSHCSSTAMVSCMCVYSYLSLPCISTSPKLTLNTIMFEFFIFDSYYDLCFPSHI